MLPQEFEWVLLDVPNGDWHAGGTAPTQEEATREAMHYLEQYANDDVGMRFEVFKVTRESLGGIARIPGEKP